MKTEQQNIVDVNKASKEMHFDELEYEVDVRGLGVTDDHTTTDVRQLVADDVLKRGRGHIDLFLKCYD